MELKYTFQGFLIYSSMAAYLTAFVITVLRRPRLGPAFYCGGFVIAVISFGYRWYHVNHIPMQNLFEVFVMMGALIYPLSVFCRRVLRVGTEVVDMLIGVMVLVPPGFFFSADPQQLPPALQCWLFAPHVVVYMLSYILMTKAAVQSLAYWSAKNRPAGGHFVDYERGTYRMISFGFPLMTLGLVLGSWWGHLAWGDFWGWDPKELWSLATWLIYLVYFHFRSLYGRTYKHINSMWAILGFMGIVITLLWVNLAEMFIGLHSYAL